jgi:hypothetical protein
MWQTWERREKGTEFWWETGPYYLLGTTGTVPRAHDIFRAYEGMEGRKNKNKGINICKN